jgi:hypothetical protein
MLQGNADHDWFEFYKKFVNEAVHEIDPNHQAVDAEMTKKLVKGSPKEAQMTIQVLWSEYLKLKEEGNKMHMDFRLHVCSLAAAHLLEFGYEGTEFLFKFCRGLEDELAKFMKEMNLI